MFAADVDGDGDLDVLSASAIDGKIAWYENLDDAPGVTIAESSGNTTVSETATTDAFTVVLDVAPLTDVVIIVTSGDAGEAVVDEASLTFTPDTWNTAQTVTVTGVDDSTADGTQTTTITLSIDDTNSDNAFDSVAVQTVSVTTADDDTPLWIALPAEIQEDAGIMAAAGSVSISSATTGDLVVSLASDDTGELQVPATVTILAGQTSAVFDLTVMDDSILDGTQVATITASATLHRDGIGTIPGPAARPSRSIPSDRKLLIWGNSTSCSWSTSVWPIAASSTVSRRSAKVFSLSRSMRLNPPIVRD